MSWYVLDKIGRLLLPALFCCLSASANVDTLRPGRASTARISAADDAFGILLFNEFVNQNKLRNSILAPFYVEMTLNVLADAGGGATRSELLKTIRRKEDEWAEFSLENQMIYSQLESISGKLRLHEANLLWVDKSVKLKADFVTSVTEKYGANCKTLDFASPGVVDAMNAQISEELGKSVPGVITSITPEMKMVLANTISFHGLWEKSFRSTGNLDFHHFSGSKRPVSMMYRADKYEYFEDAFCQAVRIPYYQKQLVLELFLPKENDGISLIQSKLTKSNWDQWQASFKLRQGTVILPKFGFSARIHMPKILAKFGMQSAYHPTAAGFPNMFEGKSPRLDSYVSAAIFQTDEDGELPPNNQSIGSGNNPFHMLIDRGFFFVIRHTASQRIIFIGTIVFPKDQ